MLNGFAQQTEPLTDYERDTLLPVICRGLITKVGEAKAITNAAIYNQQGKMRQEDFIEAAYNNDRESSKQEQQFFVEGCEHGYQYAVEKVCDILNHYCNRSGVHPSIRVDIINHICKAMEE